jgi:hypothetical protein
MSADDALTTIALAVDAIAIAVEILDRSAARYFPNSGRHRTGTLTLWLVAGILAAAAFL